MSQTLDGNNVEFESKKIRLGVEVDGRGSTGEKGEGSLVRRFWDAPLMMFFFMAPFTK